jgi:hypothetical protein
MAHRANGGNCAEWQVSDPLLTERVEQSNVSNGKGAVIAEGALNRPVLAVQRP